MHSTIKIQATEGHREKIILCGSPVELCGPLWPVFQTINPYSLSMELKIRRAVKEDCPRLLVLIRELALYEKAPEQVTVTEAHFEESGFGEKPVWWAFVATVPDTTSPTGERIDGFALYYIRYSTWKGQAMYLEDILITESQRGKGIGYILFQKLIEEAKEKGFNRIIWQVLEWNEPAINFYKKVNASFDPEWVNCTLDIN